MCAYSSHSLTPCQHRVEQSHFGCGFAMSLFSSLNRVNIITTVALVTSLILQLFPIIKLHSTHDMHGVVASHASSGDGNVLPLAGR